MVTRKSSQARRATHTQIQQLRPAGAPPFRRDAGLEILAESFYKVPEHAESLLSEVTAGPAKDARERERRPPVPYRQHRTLKVSRSQGRGGSIETLGEVDPLFDRETGTGHQDESGKGRVEERDALATYLDGDGPPALSRLTSSIISPTLPPSSIIRGRLGPTPEAARLGGRTWQSLYSELSLDWMPARMLCGRGGWN